VSGHDSVQLGRPRADIDATVFAAALRSVRALGYAGATMDRIAAEAGIAKSTIYRRWPSKGALIVDCLIDAFGPLPVSDGGLEVIARDAVRWIAARIAQPGVGAAFAGVFSDAVSDPALRDLLLNRFQDPYRIVLQNVTGLPEQRVLLFVDLVVGTLLHRLGMTGRPMTEVDVRSLTDVVVAGLRSAS